MTQSQSWKIVAVLMCLAFALGMMGCAPTNLEGDEQPSASAKTVTISGYSCARSALRSRWGRR